MEIAILFVAIAAMATSLVVAWNIYLSPFRPKIFADTLMLHRLSGQDPLWIAVSILFVNAGSQGGLINDIAMSIQADEGAPSTQTLWRALHIINTDPLEWVRALGTADEERPEAWKSYWAGVGT
ncbi:MAG: hypothetical protein IID00_03555 [Chloroflexi bacterium]|nr:hypothetical protein [Chloroflexota bacterium]